MKIGTTTIPFLPLSAVVVATLLVVLVLWGVRRARRHPVPAAVPGARPAVRPPETEYQPCAADWTGEVANGYLPPPAPVERPRTVADVVAERRADTAPLPVVTPDGPASDAPASDAPAPDVLAAAAPAPPAPAPDPATGDGGPASGPVIGSRGAHASEAGHRAGDPEATQDTGAGQADPRDDLLPGPPTQVRAGSPAPDATAAPGQDLSAPSDERPDTGTLAAVRARPGVTPDEPQHAVPDGPPAEHAGPEAAEDPVPPPWSAARTEHADTGLEPTDADTAPVSSGTGRRGTDEAEPVSRAVQQALAARAVQRARRRPDDVPDDAGPVAPSGPGADQGDGPGREHPLTVVPSASRPTTGADARDRLLAVLLTDPARAVGATEDLDDARDRIDRLGDVLRRRRGDLAVAVRRLHDSGLDAEQIGRLAGMGCDDVARILEARTGDGADGNRHT